RVTGALPRATQMSPPDTRRPLVRGVGVPSFDDAATAVPTNAHVITAATTTTRIQAPEGAACPRCAPRQESRRTGHRARQPPRMGASPGGAASPACPRRAPHDRAVGVPRLALAALRVLPDRRRH